MNSINDYMSWKTTYDIIYINVNISYKFNINVNVGCDTQVVLENMNVVFWNQSNEPSIQNKGTKATDQEMFEGAKEKQCTLYFG